MESWFIGSPGTAPREAGWPSPPGLTTCPTSALPGTRQHGSTVLEVSDEYIVALVQTGRFKWDARSSGLNGHLTDSQKHHAVTSVFCLSSPSFPRPGALPPSLSGNRSLQLRLPPLQTASCGWVSRGYIRLSPSDSSLRGAVLGTGLSSLDANNITLTTKHDS